MSPLEIGLTFAGIAGWRRLPDEPAPEGLVVETMSAVGRYRRLERQGILWFFPGSTVYASYTPLYWRPLAEAKP